MRQVERWRHEAEGDGNRPLPSQRARPSEKAHVGHRVGRHLPVPGSPVSQPDVLALQRSIGNQAVQRRLAPVQRKISFDNGTTAESRIPPKIKAEAQYAGPRVWKQVEQWFNAEAAIPGFTSWDAVLSEAIRRHQVPIMWGNREEFDSDDSDSESEDENRKRHRKRYGSDKATSYSKNVLNYTKDEGRRSVKGRKITDRDKAKRRKKRRVDNRAYSATDIADLQGDAKKIHDMVPKEINGKTNQSYGAT